MMLTDPSQKYRAFPQVDLPDRQWPSQVITKAPRWLSTDMRDGNQSLIDPMNAEKKRRFFDLLLKVGVKEIEVGFPAAGATEFDFISGLVKEGAIPDDVMPQVLTQAREDLIATTFESLRGAKQAIVHVYNAISPAWRNIVFQMERPQIRDIAIHAAKLLRDNAAKQPDTDWHFEYSPETFSTAELDFSLECCEAVMDILQPTPERPLITFHASLHADADHDEVLRLLRVELVSRLSIEHSTIQLETNPCAAAPCAGKSAAG